MPDERELIREFSQELISARRYKGVTIVQISDATKIQRRYLEAIEQGEWDILPQPYMEAFLKAYAEAVGMNIPKVMKRYQDMRRHLLSAQTSEAEVEVEAEAEVNPAVLEPGSGTQPSRGWIKYAVAGTVIMAVMAVASVLYFRSEKNEREPAPVEEDTSAVVQESASAPIPPDSGAPGSPLKSDSLSGKADTATLLKAISESLTIAQHEIPVGVNLLARAVQRCWLSAKLDKRETREVLLAAGDTAVFRADEEVQLVVGNAGGIELEMDGRSLGVLGPVGKAVTIIINPDGIQSQKLGKSRLAPDTSGIKRR